ncbi:MAG TPA: aspartyl/asparaginyl beta-hydroxylase domain-containing protein [Allosphingosinicella sp.]|nr:aspartyl/asparaginyl beta-hydroxylase domain-containing protein [Allosphingosinicella sp.]
MTEFLQYPPIFHYPDRLRLPLAFDPAGLASDLERLDAAAWTAHYVRDNYEGAWSVVPLRAPAGATHPVRMIFPDPSAKAFDETSFLTPLVHIRAALDTFRCPLQAVRLMRLAPGSTIREHCDPDLYAENGTARLHVPITTSADVAFLLNGEKVSMAPGSVWYLRLSDPHCVFNRGTADRVHLVVDVVVDDWLKELFDAAA